jgi:hypothetical protein
MKEKYIWSAFIRKKLNEHVEPQRKETPKGYSIGLSKKKYHATLLMLTGKRLKEISKELRMSYGTIRNWNTEREFRTTISNNIHSFIDFYTEQIPSTNIKQRVKVKDAESMQTLKDVLYHLMELKVRTRALKEGVAIYRTREGYLNEEPLIELVLSLLSKPSVSEENRRKAIVLLSFYKDQYL